MYSVFEGLNNLAEFREEDEHSYIDAIQVASNDGETVDSLMCTGLLKQIEISAWLDHEHPNGCLCGNEKRSEYKSRLRLLAGSPRERAPALRGLPWSHEKYEEIAAAFKLPADFPGSSCVEGQLITEYQAFDGGFGLLILLNRRAFNITYDPTTRTMYALLTGLYHDETKGLIKHFKDLCKSTPFITAIVASWLSVVSHFRGWKFAERRLAISDIERQFGMHWSDDINTHRDLKSMNFEVLTRKLTVLHGVLGWDECASQLCLDLISRFLTGEESFLNDHLQQQAHTMSNKLRLRLCQIRDSHVGLRLGNNEIQRRASNNLQTIYCLISQRDNKIGYDTAVASQRIAESSQRDATVMKQLARDTQKVAVHTYLDSANMRMMTLINLLTLPGTFAATFFSTGFFNFGPHNPDSLVSKWIWVYFVVTAGLTIGLLAYWLGWVTRARVKGKELLATADLDLTELIADGKTDAEKGKRPNQGNENTHVQDAVNDHRSGTSQNPAYEGPQTMPKHFLMGQSASEARQSLGASTSHSLLDSSGLSFRKNLFVSPYHGLHQTGSKRPEDRD